MSKINILDESIFNKISAGEVVERPASVVKELLDNAIDARAKNITIQITDGGIKNVTIIDDGTGIEPDDFDKVFVSHATSKIKTEEDLAKIGTLGFRGEALASIASVSRVELTSKIENETFARTCCVTGGKQTETTEVGGNNGTTISVSDIFFNVPARAKFLKKPKQDLWLRGDSARQTGWISRCFQRKARIFGSFDRHSLRGGHSKAVFEQIFQIARQTI